MCYVFDERDRDTFLGQIFFLLLQSFRVAGMKEKKKNKKKKDEDVILPVKSFAVDAKNSPTKHKMLSSTCFFFSQKAAMHEGKISRGKIHLNFAITDLEGLTVSFRYCLNPVLPKCLLSLKEKLSFVIERET